MGDGRPDSSARSGTSALMLDPRSILRTQGGILLQNRPARQQAPKAKGGMHGCMVCSMPDSDF
jgi:hypothetical protein